LNNAFGDMLLNFVMAMMFIVLPTFWVMALGWAGVRAGKYPARAYQCHERREGRWRSVGLALQCGAVAKK
jgi:hypothetical protein